MNRTTNRSMFWMGAVLVCTLSSVCTGLNLDPTLAAEMQSVDPGTGRQFVAFFIVDPRPTVIDLESVDTQSIEDVDPGTAEVEDTGGDTAEVEDTGGDTAEVEDTGGEPEAVEPSTPAPESFVSVEVSKTRRIGRRTYTRTDLCRTSLPSQYNSKHHQQIKAVTRTPCVLLTMDTEVQVHLTGAVSTAGEVTGVGTLTGEEIDTVFTWNGTVSSEGIIIGGFVSEETTGSDTLTIRGRLQTVPER